MSSHRITLCPLDSLTPGFEVEGLPIAVVRIGDDVYAIGDRCIHQDVSLSKGAIGSPHPFVKEPLRHRPRHAGGTLLRLRRVGARPAALDGVVEDLQPPVEQLGEKGE